MFDVIDIPKSAYAMREINCEAPHGVEPERATKMLWRAAGPRGGEWLGLCVKHVDEIVCYARALRSQGGGGGAMGRGGD